MAQKYKVKLISKEEIAVGTMAFKFEKPTGFIFKAGQTLDWTLINPAYTDAEGNTRTFSIIASSEENYLGFATRMRDTAFKRTLRMLTAGSEIEFEGPFGSFNLHNDSMKPAVMLAGGIGITPFFSMIKDATSRKLDHHIFLFYSNRKPEDTAFNQELMDLDSQNPNFKLIETMTETEKSAQAWQGETGYITKDMIGKYIPDLNNVIFYLAGPPSMVLALNEMLQKAGINTDNIKFEEFSGY